MRRSCAYLVLSSEVSDVQEVHGMHLVAPGVALRAYSSRARNEQVHATSRVDVAQNSPS